MKADIRQLAEACVPCQKAKVGRHIRSPFESFPSPNERFAHVHVDITKPLSLCEGHSYLLTCVGRFSRWWEAFLTPDITAYTTAKTFVTAWVSRFGVSAVITSDRGKQFESDLVNQLMKLLGSKRTKTTAYHAEANGLVERFHRSLKSALRAWMNLSKCSSAEMVYGTTLRLPERFFLRPPQKLLDMTSFVNQLTLKMANLVYNSPAQCQKPTHMPKPLEACTHVFVRDLAKNHTPQPSDRGPFKVLKMHPKFYEVEIKKFHRILQYAGWNLLLWMLHGLAWTLQGLPTTTTKRYKRDCD